MKLYSFASENLTNIWAGIGAGMWAVGDSENATFVKGRISTHVGGGACCAG